MDIHIYNYSTYIFHDEDIVAASPYTDIYIYT